MPDSLPSPKPSARIEFLDALRGVAALAVVLFHFTQQPESQPGGPAASGFTWLAGHGFSAVYVFFVLSGFVLPWSMDRSGYTPRRLGTFLGKRLLRLWPPCALILLLMAFHRHGWWPGVAAWQELWPQGLYLAGVLEKPRYLEIFWTLELEMQFYLAVALVYPALVARQPWVRRALLVVLCLLPLASRHEFWLPHYLGFFAMGMAVFWWKSARCSGGEMLGWVALALAGSQRDFNWLNLSAGLLTVGLLCYPPPTPSLLAGLGRISYSLYLSHFMAREIAGLHLPTTAQSPWGFAAVVALQTTWAIGFAVIFYWVIEKPSQHWAAQLRHTN